jgi:hypothetical protein
MMMSDVSDHTWRRSTRCSTTSCVEVMTASNTASVRDSKIDGGEGSPVLTFDEKNWMMFVSWVARSLNS